MTVPTTAAAPRPVRLRWIALATLALWLFVSYLVIVLPVDRIIPAIDRWYVAGSLLPASCASTYIALRWFAARHPDAENRLKGVTLLTGVLLSCFLAVDVGFTVHTNLNPGFRVDQSKIFEQRARDPHEWDGEVMPVLYAPTDKNFWLYKPGQVKAGSAYGELYYSSLARHPILRDSVLELHKIDFVIDRYGLRNVDDPARARIFALGDSFCFGYHVAQNATFTELLKSRLGEPVYNMGVSGTSPMQQLMLFDYLLRTYPDAFRPQRLLWLIFEGNDLEESYDTTSHTQRTSRGLREIFAGTMVAAAADIPALVRQQSVIRRLSGGQIVLTDPLMRHTAANHYELDDEPLAYPLYHSARFGYAIFRQAYLDQAGQSERDVLNHPNLPRLVDTFHRMQTLALQHGFAVTVVLVPTNVRLYKDYFAGLPRVSEQPYFLDYVKTLAGEVGFAHVDLVELLAPYAKDELIYQRDDTHWNERGHELVAEILAQRVLGLGR
jgi:hypothetical protein